MPPEFLSGTVITEPQIHQDNPNYWQFFITGKHNQLYQKSLPAFRRYIYPTRQLDTFILRGIKELFAEFEMIHISSASASTRVEYIGLRVGYRLLHVFWGFTMTCGQSHCALFIQF